MISSYSFSSIVFFISYWSTIHSDTCLITLNYEAINTTKPKILGYFSFTENRQYIANARSLKYLKLPENVSLNLNEGHEYYVKRTKEMEGTERTNGLLRWLHQQNYLQNIMQDQKNLYFIAHGGAIVKILQTPYELQKKWLITATKIGNIIILFSHGATPSNRKKEEVNDPIKKSKFEYWGFKFEQYLLANNLDELPNTQAPVQNYEEFLVVYEKMVFDKKIIYVAEIDGVESDVPVKVNDHLNSTDVSKFIELKTNRFINQEKNEINFRRYKLLKWYNSCLWSGIEKIYCGVRSDEGFVYGIEKFDTKELPFLAQNMWDPNCCTNFLNEFLTHVKRSFLKEKDFTIFRYDMSPIRMHIKRSKVLDDRRLNILPTWFKSKLQNVRSKFLKNDHENDINENEYRNFDSDRNFDGNRNFDRNRNKFYQFQPF